MTLVICWSQKVIRAQMESAGGVSIIDSESSLPSTASGPKPPTGNRHERRVKEAKDRRNKQVQLREREYQRRTHQRYTPD